jgi:hypothetical protein
MSDPVSFWIVGRNTGVFTANLVTIQRRLKRRKRASRRKRKSGKRRVKRI